MVVMVVVVVVLLVRHFRRCVFGVDVRVDEAAASFTQKTATHTKPNSKKKKTELIHTAVLIQ